MTIPNTLFPDFPQAACIGQAEHFDGRRQGEAVGKPHRVTLPRHVLAKQICALCPHLQQCRDWALAHHGDPARRNGIPRDNGPVIGGMTDWERINHRRQHHMPDPAPATFKHLRSCGHENDGNGRGGMCTECRATLKREDTARRQHDRYNLDVSSGRSGTRTAGCRAGHPPEAMYQRLDKRNGRRCKMCENEYNQKRTERRRRAKKEAA